MKYEKEFKDARHQKQPEDPKEYDKLSEQDMRLAAANVYNLLKKLGSYPDDIKPNLVNVTGCSPGEILYLDQVYPNL